MSEDGLRQPAVAIPAAQTEGVGGGKKFDREIDETPNRRRSDGLDSNGDGKATLLTSGAPARAGEASDLVVSDAEGLPGLR